MSFNVGDLLVLALLDRLPDDAFVADDDAFNEEEEEEDTGRTGMEDDTIASFLGAAFPLRMSRTKVPGLAVEDAYDKGLGESLPLSPPLYGL